MLNIITYNWSMSKNLLILLLLGLNMLTYSESFDNDLALLDANVKFSTNTPILDQDFRVYATVTNNSKKDLSWIVRFFDEKLNEQIWKDEAISVLAWATDDVYIDWKITWYWSHIIDARVIPVVVEWDNPSNNKVKKNIFVDLDTDKDSIPNSRDKDIDDDWALNDQDAFPLDSKESKDTDWDWIWDNSDLDIDNDWLANAQESKIWTNNFKKDTDSDWINDWREVKIWTNPLVIDVDWDWLQDWQELKLWTSPHKKDTDSDWLLDNQELKYKTLVSVKDTDWDSVFDWQEVKIWTNPLVKDTDWDWLLDGQEPKLWTSPLKKDTDWDSINDLIDKFPIDPNEWKDSNWNWIWDFQDSKWPHSVIDIKPLEWIYVWDEIRLNWWNSKDESWTIVKYVWNIEKTDFEWKEITYTFNRSGTYRIRLVITDNLWNTNESYTDVLVLDNKYINTLYWLSILLLFLLLIILLISRLFGKNQQIRKGKINQLFKQIKSHKPTR